MNRAVLALAVALAPFAANAADISLDKPMQGATLIGPETDMSVYFVAEDDNYRVHAVYVGKEDNGQPQQLVMQLRDGDAVSFSLPGHQGETYSFARNGNSVQVGSQPSRTGEAS